jgi:hypothetical protein
MRPTADEHDFDGIDLQTLQILCVPDRSIPGRHRPLEIPFESLNLEVELMQDKEHAAAGRLPELRDRLHTSWHRMRSTGRTLPTVAALVAALGGMLVTSAAPAEASSPADQGVTAKTITVGLPYVNLRL